MTTSPRADAPADPSAATAAADAMATSIDGLRRMLSDGSPGQLPDPPAGSPAARVRASLGLDAFSWSVVVLTAAMELQPGMGQVLARMDGHVGPTAPTFGLALAHLPEPTWQALTPAAPLRARGIVELGPGEVLTERPLRLHERVLHALLGADYLEPALADRLVPCPPATCLPDELGLAARELADAWRSDHSRIHLWVPAPGDGEAVAAEAAHQCGRHLHLLPAATLPRTVDETAALRLAWAREHRLSPLALALDLDTAEAGDGAADATDLVTRLDGPVVTISREPRPDGRTHLVRVRPPTFDTRRRHWAASLAAHDLPRPPHLDDLVARFALSPTAVDRAATVAGEVLSDDRDDPDTVGAALWSGARALAHPQLEGLAQRIDVRATWDDLVLPDAQRAALEALLAQARHRATVEHAWGFAERGRGSAAAAVLAGPSGTGKTLAAEVLAGALDLDLFRIDLSAVVSKYIGETEKNLRRVFDAAETGGAVLLFDEADALFGKRTEVSDSHDRYANIEVSYLLQRIESFTGLALLTTNHRDHLDDAFLRRIPFAIDFPFPDAGLRRAIWQRVFPPQAPVRDLDLDRLARLVVAGGSIRSIARNAAYLAAASGEPVDMVVLRRAAALEADKLGRPLSPAEVRGWD